MKKSLKYPSFVNSTYGVWSATPLPYFEMLVNNGIFTREVSQLGGYYYTKKHQQ